MSQLEDLLNRQRNVENNIQKSFGSGFDMNEELEKARHGVYANNATNRKLNRVGQEYGNAAKEKEKSPNVKSGSQNDGGYQKMAKEASDKALKRASEDENADPKVREMAKKELDKRGNNSSKKVESNKKESKDSNNTLSNSTAKSVESAFNDLSKVLESDDWNPDAESEASDNFMDKISDLVLDNGLTEKDFSKIHDSNPSWKYGIDVNWGDVEKHVKEKKQLKSIKSDVLRKFVSNGPNSNTDEFMENNVKYFKDVLKSYGVNSLYKLQDKLENENVDNDEDPFGYKEYNKIYRKCLNQIPTKEFKVFK